MIASKCVSVFQIVRNTICGDATFIWSAVYLLHFLDMVWATRISFFIGIFIITTFAKIDVAQMLRTSHHLHSTLREKKLEEKNQREK